MSLRSTTLSFVTRVLVTLAVLAISVLIFGFLFRTRPVPPVNPAGAAPPTVVVLPVRPIAVQRQWTGYGTADAIESADVPARVGATITAVSSDVREGTRVDLGQVLARLDPTDFQHRVDVAEETIIDLESQLRRLEVERSSWTEREQLAAEAVELAEGEYQRVLDAMKKNAANQREVDASRQALITASRDQVSVGEEIEKLEPRRASLEAQKAAQEAELRDATQKVERCTIMSPLGGVVQAVDVEVGEDVRAGARIARIVNLDRIEVPLRLPASARLDVSTTNEVVLHSAGAAGRTWNATVARLSPTNDAATRTMTVYVEVDDDDRPAPGAFLRGVVISGVMTERWVVPRRSVRNDRVMVVRNGVIVSMGVKTDYHVERRLGLGVDDEQWVVIDADLTPGDSLVLTASPTLLDGMLVEPLPVEQAVASTRGAP